jgi:hypothetical protein
MLRFLAAVLLPNGTLIGLRNDLLESLLRGLHSVAAGASLKYLREVASRKHFNDSILASPDDAILLAMIYAVLSSGAVLLVGDLRSIHKALGERPPYLVKAGAQYCVNPESARDQIVRVHPRRCNG